MASPKPITSLLPSTGMMYGGLPGLPTGGQAWFVDPYYGIDGSSGRRPDRAVATTSKALSLATANQHDIIYMLARSNTGTYTTDYLTAALATTTSNSGVHIVGVNNGSLFSQRSRFAFPSTYVTASASPLVTIGGNNSLFANLEFYMGTSTNANPLGSVLVSGNRNHFYNCHIAGIGDDVNDIASAYSLKVTGAENYFENCTIGLLTVDRGSQINWEIEIGPVAGTNVFRKCIIVSRLQHATNHPQLYMDASTSSTGPGFALFDDCTFINVAINDAYYQNYIINVAAASGYSTIKALIKNCAGFTGTTAGAWVASGKLVQIVNSLINTAYTGGIGYLT